MHHTSKMVNIYRTRIVNVKNHQNKDFLVNLLGLFIYIDLHWSNSLSVVTHQ